MTSCSGLGAVMSEERSVSRLGLGTVWCGAALFGAVRRRCVRCGDGGQLQKLGRQQGASTGATEWDQRGIGSSKDGNRDWGRNVVRDGNALHQHWHRHRHQQPQRNPRRPQGRSASNTRTSNAAIDQLEGNEMTPAGEALQGPACRGSAWKRTPHTEDCLHDPCMQRPEHGDGDACSFL